MSRMTLLLLATLVAGVFSASGCSYNKIHVTVDASAFVPTPAHVTLKLDLSEKEG